MRRELSTSKDERPATCRTAEEEVKLCEAAKEERKRARSEGGKVVSSGMDGVGAEVEATGCLCCC
jgi:hypothetical protein